MKKLIVVALLALSISGIAQEKKQHTKGERPQFTAQQQKELHVKKLTLELDLSVQQQQQIAELVGKKQMNRAAMKTELKTKKAENKKLTSDEKFVLKRNALDAKIAHKNEMKKILTAEQLEKWEKMARQNKKMKHKRLKGKARM